MSKHVTTDLDRRTFIAAAATGLVATGCTAAGPTRAPARPDTPAPPPAGDGITPAIIADAERVMGVSFTPSERELIGPTVDEMLDGIRARRKHRIERATAPACTFDPVLPGRNIAIPAAPARASEIAPVALPGSDEDIAFAPVTQLADWLRRGLITSVRLTELYLARLERLAPRLECVVTLTRELALRQARQADDEIARGRIRGPLHGIPYGAKDLFDTAGIATTFGAGPYRARVPDSDATVIRRLADAGAVLVAKTTLGALAYGDIWFGGKTRNPWNPREGSSGSSAGSAAATAAGLVGFSIGTETLGSIVSPSMRCGATGLRPTFGRVPRTGAMPLVWSMDKIGPICRTVEDAALVLAALNGADGADPAARSVPFPFDARASIVGKRVGHDPAWFQGEGANDLDRDALESLGEVGVEVVEVRLPELPYQGLTAILLAEAAAAFEDLTARGDDDKLVWQDKDAWPNTFRAARFLSAIDVIQADRLRRQVMEALDRVFASDPGVDAIVSPSFSGPMLSVSNYTGHPSLTLRVGFVERAPIAWPETGADLGPAFTAPHGLTLYGRLFDEATLCAIGMALERERAVFGRRPAL